MKLLSQSSIYKSILLITKCVCWFFFLIFLSGIYHLVFLDFLFVSWLCTLLLLLIKCSSCLAFDWMSCFFSFTWVCCIHLTYRKVQQKSFQSRCFTDDWNINKISFTILFVNQILITHKHDFWNYTFSFIISIVLL